MTTATKGKEQEEWVQGQRVQMVGNQAVPEHSEKGDQNCSNIEEQPGMSLKIKIQLFLCPEMTVLRVGEVAQ